jgi:chromosome partitioning protein
MRTVAIANMKGGVGKTTTAVHVAAGLARRGQRVLLIDTDPQGNVAHVFGMRPPWTLKDLILGEAPLDAVVQRGVRDGLDVIASDTASFSLETQLAGQMQRETILSRRLKGLTAYDTVILDTSPAMNLLSFNALLFAREVILPVSMDAMALIGARQTLNGIREMSELWPDRPLRLMALLPTSVNPATVATRAAWEAMERDAGMSARLYRPGIRQCIDLTYAMAQRSTVWEYAPRSRAAEDYDRFLDFMVSEAVENTNAQEG